MTWMSSKHNMGMSLTRDTWNMIKNCSTVREFLTVNVCEIFETMSLGICRCKCSSG